MARGGFPFGKKAFGDKKEAPKDMKGSKGK